MWGFLKSVSTDVPVVELRSEQVMTWKSELLDRLAPSTVADTRATLKQVLDQAVDHGLIVRNPVDTVKPPTVVENKDRRVLTRDQHGSEAATDGPTRRRVARSDSCVNREPRLFIQGVLTGEV